MRKSFFTLLIVSLTAFVGSAHADANGKGAKEFYKMIDAYRQSCAHGCHTPFKDEEAFDIGQPENSVLSVVVKTELEAVAKTQTEVWGDTILEGDYYSEGQTRLDYVMALYKDSDLLGYKITYSEHAWFTGECDFDGEDNASLKGCQEGRIHESTFVSPDFKTFFRDENDLADFAD